MTFFDDIGEAIGSLNAAVYKPIIDYENQQKYEQWKKQRQFLNTLEQQAESKKAIEAEQALQKVIALEQQRSQAENPQIPLQPQQWGIPEQLALYSAYGQANIDPKDRAEAQIARQKARVFNEELEKIQNPAARINIAQGKEYKPVDVKGGVAFNPYNPEDWFISSTPESKATIGKTKAETGKINQQTRLEKTRTEDAALRLSTVKNLLDNPEIHPLLAADIAQDKSVFKGERIKVDDGKGNLTESYAVLTPSGLMKGNPITDKATGEPLKIPPESKGGESSKLQQARELVKHGRAKDLNEALTILTSTLADAPAKAWSKIVDENSKKDFTGNQPKKEKILSNSITQWIMGRQGKPFPVNIVDTINESSIPEKTKEDLLATVDRYNQSIARLNQPTPAKVQTEPQPETPMPANLPQQATPKTITQTELQTSSPQQPAQTAPSAKLLSNEAITNTPEIEFKSFAESILTNNTPEEVWADLEKKGISLSHEDVVRASIDAVNRGVSIEEVQELMKFLGINWQPQL